MFVIRARNVNDALPKGLALVQSAGVERESRNGPVIQIAQPTTTVYERPWERVIFWEDRDANPFFHLFESLWMLAGRNDVAYPSHFAKNIRNYSDDGRTLHGAYGHRWREHFGGDQLSAIISALKEDRTDRRQVLQMWDARADLGRKGKDLPCNTQVFFSVNADDQLDMTVCNRSNDMIWGAYGANAVHFSFLQEYVALAVGVTMGRYWQVSNNLHVYKNDVYKRVAHLADVATISPAGTETPYTLGEMGEPTFEHIPLFSNGREVFDQDLLMFLENPSTFGIRERFFRRVAVPMWHAHAAFVADKGVDGCEAALEIMEQCASEDWRVACCDWLQRRKLERAAKASREQG